VNLKVKQVTEHTYHVGDSGCSVFLVDTHSEDGLVLIDCGMSLEMIKNIKRVGLSPKKIKHCIITHFHIDHIGACHDLKEFNPQIRFYAHEMDAEAIEEKGHDSKTAASWYNVDYIPIKLEKKLTGDKKILHFGNYDFQCIHTPGHTPGSICVYVDIDNKKCLFGQDIHGPFYPAFGSNLDDYQKSMKKLLNLEIDILFEGHYGIFQPSEEVYKYIKRHMYLNQP
jgi:glyoxylase-like metal-dependent hydrolase (beta-lactamase superfamily II)